MFSHIDLQSQTYVPKIISQWLATTVMTLTLKNHPYFS
ncbi:hypothetical Protein YC6258_04267 [Gynuella sunshinyii YC6258]|uniref:Uncharacterized protein n=1 Tax=Gynuella sunshinyii YC6258 TaxID=1445510 RepID=A0A0C5VPZ9_9GAMM|nr:hypothetical Protein YC6258_04267 [Gynuella sunshinyii YC6258]